MFDGAITCKKLYSYLYFNVCTAQEVDGESFLLLKEDNLKEMLPLHCSWSSNKIQGGNSTQGRPIGVFPGPLHACV